MGDGGTTGSSTTALARKIAERGFAVGAWLFHREPIVAEMASRAGFDFVCVDLQHGFADFDRLAAMVQGVAAGAATPVVRVPDNQAWMIGRALDAGAMGVIVPLVNTPADARRAADACRYPPAGSRSIGPIAASVRSPSYVADAARDVLCIVMIETVEAVEHADDIVATPGVDMVYVGPSDLSLSMGLHPGRATDDPAFEAALAGVVDACRRHGVIPGIHGTASAAARRRADGFRFMSVCDDHGGLATTFDGALADSRAARNSPPRQ
jgi:4-hydroxy-2-oxoheptanedioate aldolase